MAKSFKSNNPNAALANAAFTATPSMEKPSPAAVTETDPKAPAADQPHEKEKTFPATPAQVASRLAEDSKAYAQTEAASDQWKKSENKTAPRRRAGRPKTRTEETRNINIAVPVSVLKKLDTAKVCYSNNLTQYINTLIEKDLKANYEHYSHIAESLNSLMDLNFIEQY